MGNYQQTAYLHAELHVLQLLLLAGQFGLPLIQPVLALPNLAQGLGPEALLPCVQAVLVLRQLLRARLQQAAACSNLAARVQTTALRAPSAGNSTLNEAAGDAEQHASNLAAHVQTSALHAPAADSSALSEAAADAEQHASNLAAHAWMSALHKPAQQEAAQQEAAVRVERHGLQPQGPRLASWLLHWTSASALCWSATMQTQADADRHLG